jgi:hypothetical protein
MKSIELTEDHKSKLLEMCKVLFPEYEFCFHHHDEGKPDKNIPYNFLPGFIFGFKKYEDGSTSENYHDVDIFIHWFEFCTITLWNELYLKLGNLELKNYYELLLNNLIHPVDYLYEEFLKLKL